MYYDSVRFSCTECLHASAVIVQLGSAYSEHTQISVLELTLFYDLVRNKTEIYPIMHVSDKYLLYEYRLSSLSSLKAREEAKR